MLAPVSTPSAGALQATSTPSCSTSMASR
ncbi:MAG TPA: DUF3678 domain-containing protein [Planctomycetes bacterium]|nr:DUF3678 domain-containing protein [Planctomycetota bacterium]